jgi:flagellar basal body-associated protein FliL
MVPTDITLIIILVVTLFLGICIAGFITFSRFLTIEKEKAKRFRARNPKPRDLDRRP